MDFSKTTHSVYFITKNHTPEQEPLFTIINVISDEGKSVRDYSGVLMVDKKEQLRVFAIVQHISYRWKVQFYTILVHTFIYTYLQVKSRDSVNAGL